MTPRETPHLFGHEAAETALAAAAAAGRLHHAWLIGGPRGIGKATLAFRFARWLLAGLPPADPPSLALDPRHGTWRRVAAETHADLLTIALRYDPVRKRDRTEIAVDDVREVTDFLRRTPAEGGWRVVVVDGAEAMNPSSANALLKSLEEPPPRAVLLLVSHLPGALLPTLRSRCRALTLAPLDLAAMNAALDQVAPDLVGPARDAVLALADGAPGRALAFAADNFAGQVALAAEVLDLLPTISFTRSYEIADAVVASETGFSLFLELLRRLLAQAVRDAAAGGTLPLGRKLAALRPLDAWSEAWQAIGALRHHTERFYMDKRQAVLQALDLLTDGGS